MTAPTTRETADHAELGWLAEAAQLPFMSPSGAIYRRDAFIAAFTPAVCSALLSEIAALRGEVGDLKRHRDRLAITCQRRLDDWRSAQAQATQAERQRDEAVGLLREWMGTWFVDSDSRGEKVIADDTRKYLLANQGADQ